MEQKSSLSEFYSKYHDAKLGYCARIAVYTHMYSLFWAGARALSFISHFGQGLNWGATYFQLELGPYELSHPSYYKYTCAPHLKITQLRPCFWEHRFSLLSKPQRKLFKSVQIKIAGNIFWTPCPNMSPYL